MQTSIMYAYGEFINRYFQILHNCDIVSDGFSMKRNRGLFSLTLFILFATALSAQNGVDDQFTTQREQLVDILKETYPEYEERIFTALIDIPRDAFVPAPYKKISYEQNSIPLGNGVTLASPDFYTRILGNSVIAESASVLVLGYGAGYCAALYSRLVDSIYLMEYDSASLQQYQELFREQRLNNIQLNRAAAEGSWMDMAPFDTICIHGAVTVIPEILSRNLKQGGRLVFSLTDAAGFQVLAVIQKDEEGFSLTVLGESFVTRIEEYELSGF